MPISKASLIRPSPRVVPVTSAFGFTTTSAQIVCRSIIYEDTAYAYFTPVIGVETITADKWWQQLTIPVRRRTIIEGIYSAAPPTPQANDQTAWHRPLEVPRRRKAIVEGAYSVAPPKPEANDQLGWYRPLEAPWRPKRLPQAAIPDGARTAFPVVPWGWYAELGKPARLAKTPATQIGYTFIAAAPGSAVAQNWFHQLDTPTRARRLYEFPATAIPVYFVPPSPGAGNELNWWPRLEEPVRPRITIRTAQQQGLTIPPRLLTTTLENAWFVQLNEPVRLKVTFGKYPQTAQGNINPIVPLAWSSIDEPRRLRGKYNYPAVAQANINPIVPLAWQPLHTPHRLKGRIDYPAFAYGSHYPGLVAEVVTIDKWWAELHRPTGGSRRLPISKASLIRPRRGSCRSRSPLASPPRARRSFAGRSSTRIGPNLPMPSPSLADRPTRASASSAFPRARGPRSSPISRAPLWCRPKTRTATVPELLRVVDVPDQTRTVNSNDYRDRPCHDT